MVRVSKKAACMTSTPTKQDPVNARWNDRLLLPLYFCRACEDVKFGGRGGGKVGEKDSQGPNPNAA